jgi:hypothetical protein
MTRERSLLPAGVLPAWTHVVGSGKSRCVVYEDLARGRQLTLRWWGSTNWRRQSLGRTLERDRRGRVTPDSEQWAKDQATVKSAALIAGTPEATIVLPQRFTIGETRAAITDKKTGKYPHDTEFRKELLRAVDFAAIVWGAATPWATIEDTHWTALLRQRLESLVLRQKQGVRTTQITVSRLVTVATWLRDTKKIPREAGYPPRTWKQDILDHWRGVTGSPRDPIPHRPRHTLDELRALLDASWVVDPRLGLMVGLGAEYRLGQIVRAMRSDLDVAARTLVVHGQGKKGGETIALTDGQMRAVFTALGGYLDDCEERYLADGTDYPLFPSGRLIRREQLPGHRESADVLQLGRRRARRQPFLTRRWITRRFHLAEEWAGITPEPGRAAYGLRRQNVDAVNAAGISRHGLKAAGGWSSTKIPDEVYAEQENQLGRAEAMRVRAQTRGEQ